MENGKIQFWVPGIPQPGGSKKAFYIKKLGRSVVTESNPRAKDWRASVAQAATDATRNGVPWQLLEGPLRARFDFVVVRPKGHFGSGRNAGVLKASAPAFPAVKPDATKLIRSTEDALTGILWRDDAQVVTQGATKRYGEQAGAWITVAPEKA